MEFLPHARDVIMSHFIHWICCSIEACPVAPPHWLAFTSATWCRKCLETRFVKQRVSWKKRGKWKYDHLNTPPPPHLLVCFVSCDGFRSSDFWRHWQSQRYIYILSYIIIYLHIYIYIFSHSIHIYSYIYLDVCTSCACGILERHVYMYVYNDKYFTCIVVVYRASTESLWYNRLIVIFYFITY